MWPITITLLSLVTAITSFEVKYYHELSRIDLIPDAASKVDDRTFFGSSMSYLNKDGGTLEIVVGAPDVSYEEQRDGDVYDCKVNLPIKESSPCKRLPIDPKKSNYTKSSTQSFGFGTSIVSLSKSSFLACAPLMPFTIETGKYVYNGSYGTCFTYDTVSKTSPYEYYGLVEQNMDQNNKDRYRGVKYYSMYGGTGFSMISDINAINSEDSYILMGKPAHLGDIHYIHIDGSQNLTVHSIVEDATSNGKNDLSVYASKDTDNSKNVGDLNFGYAIASGNFFTPDSSSRNYTAYAFTIQDENMEGKIGFLKKNEDDKKIEIRSEGRDTILYSGVIGAMFGTVLAAADMTGDGYDELIVGAPAYSAVKGDYVDAGAIFIYHAPRFLMRKGVKNATIFSNKTLSRFGSAIATSDLDGDTFPEIFVGAPFEDDGAGAVYILNGYEVKELLESTTGDDRKYNLFELLYTQRIQHKEFQWFGYTILVIPDINENGCDELAVSSPRSNKVHLFQCMPAVTASLIAIPKMDTQALTATILVGVNITYPTQKNEQITTTLLLDAKAITRGADLNGPKSIDLDGRTTYYPLSYTLTFQNKDPGYGWYDYEISLRHFPQDMEKKELNKGWVTVSPRGSNTSVSDKINRCEDETCRPKLEMKIIWNNSSENSDVWNVTSSSSSSSVTITVINDGMAVYHACLKYNITKPGQAKEQKIIPIDFIAGKTNRLIPPIIVDVNTANSTNDQMLIEATLYSSCSYINESSIHKIKTIEYMFDTVGEINITYKGRSVYNLTERQKDRQKKPIQEERSVYSIKNHGYLNWGNVSVFITIPKKIFIHNTTVKNINDFIKDCTVIEDNERFVKHKCDGYLPPKSEGKPASADLIVVTNIAQKNIDENDFITYQAELVLHAIKDFNSSRITTSRNFTILYTKEEKHMEDEVSIVVPISIAVALLLLIIIAFVLYKMGFFRRKKREELGQVRQEGGRRTKPEDENEVGMEMEIVDDAFEPAPATSSDSRSLISNSRPTSSQDHPAAGSSGLNSNKPETAVPYEKFPKDDTILESAL